METVKHVHAIEYRNKTEPPTEPGHYYVRGKGDWADDGIVPAKLGDDGWVTTTILAWGGDVYTGPALSFDFFGPVRIVKEG